MTDQEITERWSKYFQELLRARERVMISNKMTQRVHISEKELLDVRKKLKYKKSTNLDDLSVEMTKTDSKAMTELLVNL